MRIFKRILFILVCIGLIWLIFILLSKAFSEFFYLLRVRSCSGRFAVDTCA